MSEPFIYSGVAVVGPADVDTIDLADGHSNLTVRSFGKQKGKQKGQNDFAKSF